MPPKIGVSLSSTGPARLRYRSPKSRFSSGARRGSCFGRGFIFARDPSVAISAAKRRLKMGARSCGYAWACDGAAFRRCAGRLIFANGCIVCARESEVAISDGLHLRARDCRFWPYLAIGRFERARDDAGLIPSAKRRSVFSRA